MFRVALINMPFGSVARPSIALTQLKSVLNSNLPGKVEARVLYLNCDFAEYLGLENYELISGSMDALYSGLGDWFFRSAAFPGVADNLEAYRRRYPRPLGSHQDVSDKLLLEKRETLMSFLDELIDRYRLDDCSLAGLTSVFQQNVACIAMARRLKERNPDVVTVMGGANCETSMGRVLAREAQQIDFVFSGPALRSFPEFVSRLLDGEEERCHDIKGVFSRKKLAQQVEQPPKEIGDELDIDVEVPLDYSDYFAARDQGFPDGAIDTSLLFETSRGCWWGERAHCTFCGLNGLSMGYRSMQPQKALEQFEKIFEYSPKVSRFEAVDNIIPREYLSDVFPYVESPKTMFYEVKADLKDHEMEILAKAGVDEIQPGIEALSTSTLKLMRKGTTAYNNVAFLQSCLTHQISPAWNLLVGFPREGEEVYEKYDRDLPLLVHLPPPGGVYPVRFDRFSPYFDLAKEYGLKLKPYPFYDLIYPFDSQSTSELAYYFVDETINAPYVQAMLKWIDRLRERVSHWRSRWDQADNGLKPRLRFLRRNGAILVHDSRSGEAVELEIGATGVKILEGLASPLTRSRLAGKLREVAESELDDEIASLRERGLIFQEGHHLLSLVEHGSPQLPDEQDASESEILSGYV